jgi:hypothetical protein
MAYTLDRFSSTPFRGSAKPIASTPSAHLKASKHDISYACASPGFNHHWHHNPPLHRCCHRSLRLRLSGNLSWCNKNPPSASLIPYTWPTHRLQPHVKRWRARFHPALLRPTPLSTPSSYRLGLLSPPCRHRDLHAWTVVEMGSILHAP